MSETKFPLYTSQPCVTSNCENSPEQYDTCIVCQEEIIMGAPVMHLFRQQKQGDAHTLTGNICLECQNGITESGSWEHLRDYISRFESREALADETYRALIVQAESIKKHLDWLESQIRVQERNRTYHRDKASSLRSMFSGEIYWKRMSKEDSIKAFAETQARKAAQQTPPPKQLPSPATSGNVKRKGYIYLVASSEGHYKIGRSKDVPTRVNTLSIQLPFEVQLLHSFSAEDYVRAEQIIHERFTHLRLNGEWFKLGTEEIEWFKSLTTFEEAVI